MKEEKMPPGCSRRAAPGGGDDLARRPGPARPSAAPECRRVFAPLDRQRVSFSVVEFPDRLRQKSVPTVSRDSHRDHASLDGLFAMGWPNGERLSWRGWLGLLIGFAGIVLTKLDDGSICSTTFTRC